MNSTQAVHHRSPARTASRLTSVRASGLSTSNAEDGTHIRSHSKTTATSPAAAHRHVTLPSTPLPLRFLPLLAFAASSA
jgi:hypothetical protein